MRIIFFKANRNDIRSILIGETAQGKRRKTVSICYGRDIILVLIEVKLQK